MRFLFVFVLFSAMILSQAFDPSKIDTSKNRLPVPGDTTRLPRSPRDSVVVDTLVPVYQIPLQGALYEYDSEYLRYLNYRNGATLFSQFPVAYNRSMGFLGLPSEITYYGEGLGRISFLEDGIEINNRTTNTLYFDDVQESYIEKLSLYPSYMGFLYGNRPNQITVSITGRDFVSGAPYSRIKYFEGPVGEGYIDVQFNQTIKNRLVFYTEITNQKVDDGFRNSDLSLWKGKINLKYIASKYFNLSAGYNYVQQSLGLNGGVNYDSAKTLAASIPGRTIDDILYDDRAAPVNFLNRYQKNASHRINLKAFGYFAGKGYFEGALYHQTNTNEFRQNEDSLFTNPNRFMIDRKFSATGGSFRTTFDTKYFAADVHANYDAVTQESFWFDSSSGTFVPSGPARKNSFSAGGILTGKAGGFALSGFGKLFIYEGEVYTGFGGEGKAEFAEYFKFRGGVSWLNSFDQDYGYINAKTSITRVEGELGYADGVLSLKLLGWAANSDRTLVGTFMPTMDPMVAIGFVPAIEPENFAFGAAASADYKIGPFSCFADIRYNHKRLKDSEKNIIPLLNSKVGIVFRDTLFNDALDLKTTLSYSYRTSSVATFYNFFTDRVLYTPFMDDVPASGQLDFALAGTIQKVATLYFSWENLLGSKYYLSPYYPVLPRNIRFGISWEFLN